MGAHTFTGALRAAIPRSVRTAEVAMIAALTAVAILFGSAIIRQPLYAFAFAAFVGLAAAIVWYPRVAVAAALSFLVLIEEFELSSTEAFFESGISKSILALRIAGVSFPDALTLIFLIPAMIRVWHDWRVSGVPVLRPLDRLFLPILLVYAWGAVMGLFHYLTPSHFSWEARDIITIVAWYFVVSRTFSTRRDVVLVIAVILLTFSVKSLLFAYRAVAGEGLFYGFDFYRRALGSDVPMTALPLVTLIGISVLVKDPPRWFRVLIIGLIGYWSVWFVGSLGRATYLAAALAMVSIFLLMRRQVRPVHVLLPLGAAVVGGMGYYWLILTEANRALVSNMLGTSINWVDAIMLYEDKSMGQRVMEIMNISETLSRSGAWLWGLGWGAPWEELVVHHPIDVASFEHMEAVRGIHTSAHIDAVYYLLKVGIAGTTILYIAYLRFVRTAMRLFHRESDMFVKAAMLAIIAMILIFLPNFVYFLKLKILLGAAFGCLCILDRAPEVSSAPMMERPSA